MSKSREELRTIVERLNSQARCLLTRMKVGEAYLPSQLQELLGQGTKARAVGAVGWLIANGLAEETGEEDYKRYVSLADKGQAFQEKGIPEGRIVKLLREKDKLTIQELGEKLALPKEELNPILGNMKKERVISFESGGRVALGEEAAIRKATERYAKVNNLLDRMKSETRVDLMNMLEDEEEIVKDLSRKRGKGKAIFRIAREVEMRYRLTLRGKEAQAMCGDIGEGEEIGSLTPEILEKGSWRGQTFRKYDINTPPPKSAYGRKHPYGLFLDFVRKKLVAMGFEEMRGRMVETEFWNNDALFMPQDHPFTLLKSLNTRKNYLTI